MPLMFSVSGLRGIVDKDLSAGDIEHYARAFGMFIGSGTILLGRDTRASSPEFCRAVKKGVAHTPCRLVDLGVVPTPTVLFMVRTLRASAGMVVTASHNPPQWNALKFIMAKGRFLNQRELTKFKRFLSQYPDVANAPIKKKSQMRTDAIDRHIDRIVQAVPWQAPSLTVGVDAVNGAGFKAFPQLVRAMGCRVYKVHCTPSHYFPRGPEPRPENLSQLCHLVRVKHCDIGFACDPDCDRLSVVDETGRAIGEDMSIVLAAEYILGLHRGSVVTNYSTTSLLDYVCNRHQCQLYRTKVGEAHVVDKMQHLHAVLGGEGNGGIIDPRINMTRDALVGAALIIALRVQQGKSMSAIIRSYPLQFMIKTKIRATRERFERKRDRLRTMIRGRVNTEDGIRVTGKGYWLHIRPSQTEPLIRIIGESSDEKLIKDLVHKIQRVLS